MPVKPAYIKDIATELLDRYPEAFSVEFEQNKEAVAELTNIDSKEVRNRVAGHVTQKRQIKSSS